MLKIITLHNFIINSFKNIVALKLIKSFYNFLFFYLSNASFKLLHVKNKQLYFTSLLISVQKFVSIEANRISQKYLLYIFFYLFIKC